MRFDMAATSERPLRKASGGARGALPTQVGAKSPGTPSLPGLSSRRQQADHTHRVKQDTARLPSRLKWGVGSAETAAHEHGAAYAALHEVHESVPCSNQNDDRGQSSAGTVSPRAAQVPARATPVPRSA